MSNGHDDGYDIAWARYFKLVTQVNGLILNRKREVRAVSEVLQFILVESDWYQRWKNMLSLAQAAAAQPIVPEPAAPPPKNLWERVSETAIRVFLEDSDVTRPKNATTIERLHISTTQVSLLELRADGELYRNSRKVVLFMTKSQMQGTDDSGHEVCDEVILTKTPLHPIEGEALMANQDLIPKSWGIDEDGFDLGRPICFWALGFRDPAKALCIRAIYRRFEISEGRVVWADICLWVNARQFSRHPAAVVED